MSKATIMVILALLLCATLSCAARPLPQGETTVISETKVVEIKHAEKMNETENCEGVGEEECLMRRSLVAHLDYIYTQKTNP